MAQATADIADIKSALRHLGRTWSPRDAGYSALFVAPVAHLYEHILAALPQEAGPADCLRVLTADIANRLRADSHPHLDYLAVALTGFAQDLNHAAIGYLYDFSSGLCLSAAPAEHAATNGLWVGGHALADEDIDAYQRARDEALLQAAQAEQAQVAAQLETWQKSFAHSVAQLMADAAQSPEAQTTLVGLLRQGRAVLSAALAVKRAAAGGTGEMKWPHAAQKGSPAAATPPIQILVRQVRAMQTGLAAAQTKLSPVAQGVLKQAAARLSLAARPAVFLWRPRSTASLRTTPLRQAQIPPGAKPTAASTSTTPTPIAASVARPPAQAIQTATIAPAHVRPVTPAPGTNPIAASVPPSVAAMASKGIARSAAPPVAFTVPAPSVSPTPPAPPVKTAPVMTTQTDRVMPAPLTPATQVTSAPLASTLPPTPPSGTQPASPSLPQPKSVVAPLANNEGQGNPAHSVAIKAAAPAARTVEALYEAIAGAPLNFKAAADQITCADGHVGCNGNHTSATAPGPRDSGPTPTVTTYASASGSGNGFTITEDPARRQKTAAGNDGTPRRRARIHVPTQIARPV